MSLLPLLLIQIATVLPAGSNAASTTVTVTAPRIDGAKARLAACLARRCNPREDMAAATALAVAQFEAGDYEGARDTAGQAAGRNHRFAREFPVEVSDLLAVHGALASLTGLSAVSKARRFDVVSALRHGLGPDDQRIPLARLAVADEFARQGMSDDAVAMYDAVARHAAAAGQPAVQGRAMLQAAMLYAAAARYDLVFMAETRKRIAAINATTDPALQGFRNATVALRGQLASLQGNKRELAKVLAEAQAIRSREPMLVYNPKLDLAKAGTGTAQNPLTFEAKGQWVTIAFQIAPDGTVHDVAAQDVGRNASRLWVAAILHAVASRRYLPLDLPTGASGLVRVERASVVSNLIASTRSRILTHGGPPAVQFTNLGPDRASARTEQPVRGEAGNAGSAL